ncbi:MAG: DUF58 domain-containing protein [Microthrixaceae bacterium]
MTAFVAALLLSVGGWLFGLPEASILAVCTLLLVLFAAIWNKISRPQIAIERLVVPEVIRVNETCRIQLTTTNLGPRTTAVLLLRDRVGKFGTVELHLAPLPSGEQNCARYSFPTQHRGRHRINPTLTTVSDPFGLLRSTLSIGQSTSLLVLPHVWPLPDLAGTLGQVNESGAGNSALFSGNDAEFSGLREYVPGDDLRGIHWPTTARLGQAVVRQFEPPWQRRTTVLLDLRASASFEQSVSAAASLVDSVAQQGGLIRLVTSLPHHMSPRAQEFVHASDRLFALQEQLALIESSEVAFSPLEALRVLDAQQGGRLVICTKPSSFSEIAELQAASFQFSSRTLLTAQGPAQGPAHGPAQNISQDTAANNATARARNSASRRNSDQGSHWQHVDWAYGTSLTQAWTDSTSEAQVIRP